MAPRTPTNGCRSTTARRTSTRTARTTTCTCSSRSTSNPAHRRTPNTERPSAGRRSPLFSFGRFLSRRSPSRLRRADPETYLEDAQPHPQRAGVAEAVQPFRIEEHEVVRRELVQVADERGRGVPRLGLQLDETARSLAQQLFEDRPLSLDAQRRDGRTILRRERPGRKPSLEAPAPMGRHGSLACEDVEMVADGVQREVEPSRKLAQVEARMPLEQVEDPITRCQQGLAHGTTSLPRGTRPRTPTSRRGRLRSRATPPWNGRSGGRGARAGPPAGGPPARRTPRTRGRAASIPVRSRPAPSRTGGLSQSARPRVPGGCAWGTLGFETARPPHIPFRTGEAVASHLCHKRNTGGGHRIADGIFGPASTRRRDRP